MTTIEQLKEEIAKIKAENPKLRSVDLAHKAGISEAELTSLSAGNGLVTKLRPDWKHLLLNLEPLGKIMALTRNTFCVHERKGVYKNVEFYEGAHNMGVAVNPDIDLRFFMSQWHYGFAVTLERGKMPTLYSFQFFNENGEAVHKIYSTQKSDVDYYHKLVADFKAEDQEPLVSLPKAAPKDRSELPDESIDVAAFQQDWIDLKDTHHFFGMLRKYELSRTQAFRLAPKGYTQQVDNQAVIKMLEKVAKEEIPIMCFLHSKGCVQIHTGAVKKLKWFGNWYNI
ncbi:MAG: ChuX/HutX family heme-like substrate-binding protein, partial [Bacteroidota bacterium]